MSRPPAALPKTLGAAFTTRQALADGVTRRRLNHRGLHRPTPGLRALPDADLEQRLLALVRLLPDGAKFSHLTAARLWGFPLARNLDQRVHVSTGPKGIQIRRRGIVGHRSDRATRMLRGLPVTDPVTTWCDCAPLLSLDRLVIIGDHLLHTHLGCLQDLHQEVVHHAGRRGARALTQALALIRPGAESPMETRARLCFLRAGLPEPSLNLNVYHPVTGEWLARSDFVWEEARLIVEYEGDHHRDPKQWRRDLTRRRRLEDAGYTYISITVDDLDHHADELIRTIRTYLGV